MDRLSIEKRLDGQKELLSGLVKKSKNQWNRPGGNLFQLWLLRRCQLRKK